MIVKKIKVYPYREKNCFLNLTRIFLKFSLIFIVFFKMASSKAEIHFNELKDEYNKLLEKKYVLLPHKGTYLSQIQIISAPLLIKW